MRETGWMVPIVVGGVLAAANLAGRTCDLGEAGGQQGPGRAGVALTKMAGSALVNVTTTRKDYLFFSVFETELGGKDPLRFLE